MIYYFVRGTIIVIGFFAYGFELGVILYEYFGGVFNEHVFQDLDGPEILAYKVGEPFYFLSLLFLKLKVGDFFL